MKKRSFIIILNPVADNGKAKKKLPQIEEFFTENKADFKIIITESVGHAISIASSLSQNSEQVVVSAGGDGTSNEVINGLMLNLNSYNPLAPQQRNFQFGVIPIGRGNDFAYGAGIPGGFVESMQLLLEGEPYPLDIGHIAGGDYPEGRYFGNGIGIGFDAIVGLEAAKIRYLHGMSSYFVAALKTLILRPKAPTIEISYGNEKQVTTPALISIMNGKRMGGAFFMAPDGDMNDGLFNLTISQQGSRLYFLKAILLYMKGEQKRLQGTITTSAESVFLKSISGGMTTHADGETICVEGLDLEIKMFPSALHIIARKK
jgi:diacylglycerol kinase (ATP)